MAKVLSSISGNLISAASAGYAPTNSADVSAIASSYQVVSATAGDGTYVTSINGMGLSGQGGGGAQVVTSTGSSEWLGTSYVSEINGSGISATVAHFDSNGRDLGKLVDSATVSSIASSYQVVTATGSASVTTGWWPPFTTSYLVSSINGSALLPYGYSALSGNSANWNSVYNTVSGNSASWGAGASIPITGSAGDVTATYEVEFLSFVRNDTAGEPDIRTASLGTDQLYIDYTLDGIDHTSMSLTESMLDFMDSDGDHIVDAYTIDTWNSAVDTLANNSASWGGGATGDYVETSATEVAIGYSNSATDTAFAQGRANKASSYSFAQGMSNSAWSTSFAQGMSNDASSVSFVQGNYNSASTYSFAQGQSNKASAYSFAQGLSNSASSNSFTQGISNSAINTVAIFGKYNLRGDGSTYTGNSAAFAIGDGTSTAARHDLMLVTKNGEITMYSSTADTVGTGIMSSIRAISAAAGGGDVYISGFGYNDTAISSIEGSALYDKSAHSRITTVAGRVTNVSAAVSGTVDLVSTQSANWGGSALALSAGPGVKLEKVGNTLVAGLDETVLYSATVYAPGDTQQSYSLIETPMNFETVRVFAYRPMGNGAPWFGSVDIQIGNLYNYTAINTLMAMPYAFVGTANNIFYEGQYFINNITSTLWQDGSSTQRKTTETAYTTGYYAHIYKIIGINRTAGV